MSERREGGKILGFVGVAILFIALLGGGAYIVQRQRHVSPSMPQPTQEQPKEEQKSPSENQPAPAPQPSGNAPATQSPSLPSSTQQLPQTGVSDLLIPAVMSSLLVATILYYWQSRRQIAPL